MSIKAGRIALVTGAGHNIGKAIAIKLAAEGAVVMIQDNDYDAALSTKAQIESANGRAEAFGVKLLSSENCRNLIDTIVERYGSVDILVNAAESEADAQIIDMTDDQWNDVISDNLNPAFYCVREALKVMTKNKYGRILNISSIDYVGRKCKANYAAAKSGLIALTNVVTLEYAPLGITANCICPGNIAMESGYHTADNQQWLDELKEHTRFGVPGKPEDVAYMASILVGEEASFISGRTIAVDGGYGRVRI